MVATVTQKETSVRQVRPMACVELDEAREAVGRVAYDRQAQERQEQEMEQ